MDMLVEMSNENLAKIVTILKKKGYRVKQPVDPMGIADKQIRNEWINKKHMKALNFYKEDELKEVDIIIDSPISFRQAKQSATYMRSDNIRLPVVSIGNLIKMKQRAGRPMDKLDVQRLKLIKRFLKKSKNKRNL